MMLTSHAGVPASPMRLLEMRMDRFSVSEALATPHQAQPLHQNFERAKGL
jgi:hypothetical protein